jgi:hypothetical protein
VNRIIHVNDNVFQVLGTQKVNTTDEKGAAYWKEKWGADTVLRNGDLYYFCRNVIEAEWTEKKID